jgi:predicted outer membrane repeat protein
MATRLPLKPRMRIPGGTCLALLALLIIVAGCGGNDNTGTTGAVTRTVSANGGANFTDIQPCILASSSGDTCLVYPGTYTPINFVGQAITIQSLSGPDATFIDGGGSSISVRFTNFETSSSILSGFTVRNGLATGSSALAAEQPTDALAAAAGEANGGGIQILAASPTITDCIVKQNQAEGNGGGIYCALASSRPQLTNVVISQNTALGQGGGLFVFSGSPELKNCLMFGNEALNGGGAGAAYGADLSFINCTIADNVTPPCTNPLACDRGSGIFLDQASATLRDTILWREGRALSDPPLVLMDFPQTPTLDDQTTLSVRYTLLQVSSLVPGLIDLELTTPSCRSHANRCYLAGYDQANMKNTDPLFIDLVLEDPSQFDPRDAYYLTQTTAGPSQKQNSPAVDAGSETAGLAGLGDLTTRNGETPPQTADGSTGLEPDIIVDLGYHYAITYP